MRRPHPWHYPLEDHPHSIQRLKSVGFIIKEVNGKEKEGTLSLEFHSLCAPENRKVRTLFIFPDVSQVPDTAWQSMFLLSFPCHQELGNSRSQGEDMGGAAAGSVYGPGVGR